MSTKRSIYVGGPMTGLPNFNFDAFFEAATELRAEGWRVINPAEHDLNEGTVEKVDGNYVLTDLFVLADALIWDLNAIANYCDAIYLLQGWENSKGANAEYALAVALGKEIILQPITPPLVGIGGLLASGKDTVADYLVEHFGYTKLNMSTPLHEAMLTLNPILHESDNGVAWRYSDEWEYAERDYARLKENPEVRRLLQIFGSNVGRGIDENLWVNIAGRKIDELRGQGRPVVITGIRYPNELEMLRSRKKATALWVTRPGVTTQASHVSESSVTSIDFDTKLENDSTLKNLYAATELLAKELAA